jgi:Flp pilus assembly protein TadD
MQTVREELNISPEEFLEMGRIGALYYEQGNLEKAETIFEGLVELDPLSADAHSALGALYTQTGRDDEALVHLNKSAELNPDQIAPYVNRAEIRIRQQRMEEAVADLKQAIELDPAEKDPGANRARAIVLGLKEAFEARGAYNQTTAENPGNGRQK